MIFLIKNSNVAPPRGTCLRIEEEKGQRPAGIEPTTSLGELLVLKIKPDSSLGLWYIKPYQALVKRKNNPTELKWTSPDNQLVTEI